MEGSSSHKKRIHFFQDEKVVNDVIGSFEEVFPDDNVFVILSKDGRANLVTKRLNTYFFPFKSRELFLFLKNITEYKEVIVHSMGYRMAQIVNRINHPNITWVVWGSDLFEPLLGSKGYKLYLDKSSLYLERSKYEPLFIYKIHIIVKNFIICKVITKAINKISNLATTTDSTFKLFLNYFPSCHIRKKEIFYYPIEKMLIDDAREKYVSGMDVWINNAAHRNGNHVYIFDLIKAYNNNNIHVPLSYGIVEYANYVSEKGYVLLGEKFKPMMNFIPRNEYYNKFLNSNSFIFGHLRSCAFGNVLIAIYLGGKVFLFKNNPLFIHFKDLGVTIFSIEDELTENNLYSKLSESERKRNRMIILEHYSTEKQFNMLKNYYSN